MIPIKTLFKKFTRVGTIRRMCQREVPKNNGNKIKKNNYNGVYQFKRINASIPGTYENLKHKIYNKNNSPKESIGCS